VVHDDPIGLRGCVERATALSELGSNTGLSNAAADDLA
jgi:hypothetical protein